MTFRIFPAAALLPCAAALLFAACDRPQVSVYLAPKDAPPPPHGEPGHVHNPNDPADTHDEPPAATAASAPAPARPKIEYQLPPGWTEAPPGEVSIAAFTIKEDGAEATANVTPLPDLRGREAMVVNMYRQQTGQPPIEQAELDKTLEKVEVAGGEGQLLELVGKNREKPVRLITVIAHRDGKSWFYRISGDEPFVTKVKPAFLDFIKTIKIVDSPAPSAPAPAPATPAEAKPQP
jgi:hypothetical protein